MLAALQNEFVILAESFEFHEPGHQPNYGSIPEFVGGPMHGQWLNAIERITLGYEAQRVGELLL